MMESSIDQVIWCCVDIQMRGSRSMAGAHIFLSEDDNFSKLNGPVLTIAQIMKYILTSAAKAETAALFLTAKEMVVLRNTLEEMGWKQLPSPL